MGNDVGGPSAEAAGSGFWETLQKLAWCPVVMSPPHPDLPWAEAGKPLAPPRMARPVRGLSFECWAHCFCFFLQY